MKTELIKELQNNGFTVNEIESPFDWAVEAEITSTYLNKISLRVIDHAGHVTLKVVKPNGKAKLYDVKTVKRIMSILNRIIDANGDYGEWR